MKIRESNPHHKQWDHGEEIEEAGTKFIGKRKIPLESAIVVILVAEAGF